MENPQDGAHTVRDRDGVLYGAPDLNPNDVHGHSRYVHVRYSAVRYVNLRVLKPIGSPKTLGGFRECHVVARWLTRPGLPDEFMTQRPFYDVPKEVQGDILERFDDIDLGRAESGTLYRYMKPDQWTLDERPTEGLLKLKVKNREGF